MIKSTHVYPWHLSRAKGDKMKDKNKSTTPAPIVINTNRIDSLCHRVTGHIDQARQQVQRTIDTQMVKAYWLIGQEIVQEEQYGKERSEYGKAVLKNLSERLQKQYKRGFGVDTLEQEGFEEIVR